MSRIIMFVLEGEVREFKIADSIKKSFEHDDIVIKTAYGNDIFELYKELEKDDGLDIVEVIRELYISSKKTDPFPEITDREQIGEVFLFFDLELQDDNFCFRKLERMISFFDQETENGKLYVSYPMVESIRDIPDLENFSNHVVSVQECKGSIYKSLSASRGLRNFQDFRKFDKEAWLHLIRISIDKVKHITNRPALPPAEEMQLDIFKAQEKMITDLSQVAVLSAFPLYIYDYYGSEELQLY